MGDRAAFETGPNGGGPDSLKSLAVASPCKSLLTTIWIDRQGYKGARKRTSSVSSEPSEEPERPNLQTSRFAGREYPYECDLQNEDRNGNRIGSQRRSMTYLLTGERMG